MSPFWRALLVGHVLVAVVVLVDAYGRTLRRLASAAWQRRPPRIGRPDVRGRQWLLALGASLVSATVLFAILVTALPAPRIDIQASTPESARGSASRSANETSHRETRVALSRSEVREKRKDEQQADQ